MNPPPPQGAQESAMGEKKPSVGNDGAREELRFKGASDGAGGGGEGGGADGGARWERYGTLALCLAVFGLLVSWRLGTIGLWLDEIMSLDFCDGTLEKLWQRLCEDVHAPVFYGILWGFLKAFGVSEWAGRLPAALAGGAAIIVAHQMAREWHGARAARFASILLAVSPFFIEYSREVHPYSTAALLSIASWWMFGRVILHGRGRDAVLYALLSALLVLTFYLAALMLVAQAIWLAAANVAPRKRRRLVAAWAGTAALGLTWLPGFIAQLTQKDLRGQYVIDLYFPDGIGPADVARTLGEMIFGAAARAFPAWAGGGATLILAALAAAALFRRGRKAGHFDERIRPGSRRLIAWACWGPVALFLALCLAKPILLPRYLAMSAPLLAVYFGSAMARIEPRKGAAAIGLAMAISLAACGFYFRAMPREDWRAITNYLIQHMRPDDVVVADSVTPRSCLSYYFGLRGCPERRNNAFAFSQFEEVTRGRYPFADRMLWYLHRGELTPPKQLLLLRRENVPAGQAEFRGGWTLYKFHGRAQSGNLQGPAPGLQDK